MIKAYIIKQLTQMSAWIGFALMASSILHVPHFFIFVLGLVLILTDDKHLQALFAKWSPGVKRALGQ